MPDLRGRRVLVTGAGGFVGANLVRALAAGGALVTATVRPGSPPWRLEDVEGEVELAEVDVLAPEELVQRARPELAVSCAAVGGHPHTTEERLAQLELSVLGTARLVESLAAVGCERLVHLGSSLEYGPKAGAMREDDPLAPMVPRGAAKAAETFVCVMLARMLGLPALVLRPFSIYGPWEAESRLVPAALRAALEGAELPLVEPGIARDFVYVGDVVEAIVLGLTRDQPPAGEVVNVGSGVQTTIEELVAAVERVTGREVRARPGAFERRAHDADTWVASIDRAESLLGWRPRTSLEEGLRLTAAWLGSA